MHDTRSFGLALMIMLQVLDYNIYHRTISIQSIKYDMHTSGRGDSGMLAPY